jgi:hypothetical protein
MEYSQRVGELRERIMEMKESSGKFKIELIELTSIRERTRGLRGAEQPNEGEGVLIKARQVHTFGMRFPIDVVYLSRGGVIKKISTMPPRRIGPLVATSSAVIEMREGEARRLGMEPGMRLIEVGR